MLARTDAHQLGEVVDDEARGPMLWARDWEGQPCFVKVPEVERHFIPEGWNTMRWLVVLTTRKPQPPTKPSHDRCAMAEIQALSLPVLMPVEVVSVPRRCPVKRTRLDGNEWRARPLLPGYLLLGLAANDDLGQTSARLGQCRHVHGFLTSMDQPVCLSRGGFMRLAKQLNEGWFDESVREIDGRSEMRIGSLVEVLDGSFASFTGIVEKKMGGKVDGKTMISKALVEVDMFGRKVPVEISVDSLRLCT